MNGRRFDRRRASQIGEEWSHQINDSYRAVVHGRLPLLDGFILILLGLRCNTKSKSLLAKWFHL